MRRDKILFLLFIFLSYIPVLAQVDTAWVRRYNGLGNGVDDSRILELDINGNVYVAGRSLGSGTSDEFVIIKYSSTGDTLWVRSYNGPASGYDVVNALAIDAVGNVYVTGRSNVNGTLDDYVTVKYAPNGDTLWVRNYNGPGNDQDEAKSIAVDVDGNVYVTGWSLGNTTHYDYATIKYAPNGDTLWVRRYNGTSNDLDEAYALAIDTLGNVYVTGRSMHSGNFLDYTTIKYGPNGDTLWVRHYNGAGNSTDEARGLSLDNWGNVYVTGWSIGSSSFYDCAIIKYAPNGDTLWVRRYNGPGNGGDFVVDLIIDQAGNSYVACQSEGSGTKYDFATIKYAPNGDTLWVRRYNGPANNFDWASAISKDGFGAVYVTGSTWRDSGVYDFAYDYVTIKYSSTGELLWDMQYNGPGDSSDFANDVEVDVDFNVYVTGSSKGNGTDYDFSTIKYVQCFFKSGDPTGDGKVNLSDVIFMVNYIFKDALKPEPICTGDDTANGSVNLADIIYKINYIFKGGPAPVKSETCCL